MRKDTASGKDAPTELPAPELSTHLRSVLASDSGTATRHLTAGPSCSLREATSDREGAGVILGSVPTLTLLTLNFPFSTMRGRQWAG